MTAINIDNKTKFLSINITSIKGIFLQLIYEFDANEPHAR